MNGKLTGVAALAALAVGSPHCSTSPTTTPFMALGLTDHEKSDVAEYLKSL